MLGHMRAHMQLFQDQYNLNLSLRQCRHCSAQHEVQARSAGSHTAQLTACAPTGWAILSAWLRTRSTGLWEFRITALLTLPRPSMDIIDLRAHKGVGTAAVGGACNACTDLRPQKAGTAAGVGGAQRKYSRGNPRTCQALHQEVVFP